MHRGPGLAIEAVRLGERAIGRSMGGRGFPDRALIGLLGLVDLAGIVPAIAARQGRVDDACGGHKSTSKRARVRLSNPLDVVGRNRPGPQPLGEEIRSCLGEFHVGPGFVPPRPAAGDCVTARACAPSFPLRFLGRLLACSLRQDVEDGLHHGPYCLRASHWRGLLSDPGIQRLEVSRLQADSYERPFAGRGRPPTFLC